MDVWICRKTYSFNKKAGSAAVIYRMSVILASACLKQHAEHFSAEWFHAMPTKMLYRWCRSAPDKVLFVAIYDFYLS